MLEPHLSWQAQHLVMLQGHFRGGRDMYLVLARQVSWQGQHWWFWNVTFRGRRTIVGASHDLVTLQCDFSWDLCTWEHTTSHYITWEENRITSKWDHATWRHITSHDMTWHLATNHIIPKVTSPHNQPHYTASHLAANHIKSPRGHSISKFFLWLVVFSLWNFRPGLARLYLYLYLKISCRVVCQKLCPSHTLWRHVCETWTNTQMISNQVNGCRNLQHSRFPCAFSTFGVLEIKRGIAHMCGLLVFVKLWNASSEVLEEPCAPAGQLCGLRWLCGKNGVSLGIATAWYRIDYIAPKSIHIWLGESLKWENTFRSATACQTHVNGGACVIRIEKKKGIAFKTSNLFPGFWHLRTGDSGQHNESKWIKHRRFWRMLNWILQLPWLHSDLSSTI